MLHKSWKLSLMLCLCMLLCVGCGGSSVSESDYQRLREAFVKNQDISSSKVDGEIMLDVVEDEQSSRVKLELDGSFINKDTLDCLFQMNLAANGIKLSDQVTLAYTQDTLYLAVPGNKIQVSLQSLLENITSEDVASKDENTNAFESIDYIKNLKVQEGPDGTSFTLSYNDVWVDEILESALAKVDESLLESFDGDMEKVFRDMFESITMTYVMNSDGFLHKYVIDGEFRITSDRATSMKMAFDINVTLDSINQVETIEYPDFSDYESYDSSLDSFGDEFAIPGQSL